MNFMVTLLGWFLWNWAEYSITKQEGEGGQYVQPINKIIDSYPFDQGQKVSMMTEITKLLKAPITLGQYARDHYETWVGSLACTVLLLWLGYTRLDINPFASLAGISTGGWNDIYLLGSGAVWDAIMFAFKKVRKFFKKKESEL